MSRPRLITLTVGAAGLVAWAVLAAFVPTPALQGWLIGFVAVSTVTLGALAAMLIHRLTGGAWGPAYGLRLVPAARTAPLLCLYLLPVLLGAPLIYRWAAQPAALDPQVRQAFLSLPLFALRSAAAMLGWSLFARLLPGIRAPGGRLGAGVGLAFHGVAVSVVAVDWVLSVQPGWTSSDFGMGLAVQQLAAAFAWAGLTGSPGRSRREVGDLTGLLFAAILGLTYLEFVDFLVVWYGDRPSLDTWYLLRARPPWQAPVWIALACDLAAMALIVFRRQIGPPRALAWASAAVLAGLLSYQAWLLAPAFGAACLVPAALALLGMGGVWLALAGPVFPFAPAPPEAAHAA